MTRKATAGFEIKQDGFRVMARAMVAVFGSSNIRRNVVVGAVFTFDEA
jgi:hypothetical protein